MEDVNSIISVSAYMLAIAFSVVAVMLSTSPHPYNRAVGDRLLWVAGGSLLVGLLFDVTVIQ